MQVTSIATSVPVGHDRLNRKGLDYSPSDGGGGASSVDLVLSVVALAVLAPALIFIATATRLSAARREQRFAAMRLVGATPGQVSRLAATESTAAAILGAAVGFGVFFLLRGPVSGIPFIGQRFFPGELRLSPPDILAVGVPVVRLDSLGVDAVDVATNGTGSAVERARTVLERAPGVPSRHPSTCATICAILRGMTTTIEELMQSAADARRVAQNALRVAVREARAADWSWDRISAALGGAPNGETLRRNFGADE